MINNDELHILRLPKVIKTFSQDGNFISQYTEFLQLSMKVGKINEYGYEHTRYFVLTNKRILLLNKNTIRRKVILAFLIGITISSKSLEFILHFKNEYDDDDLRLQTENRSRLIEFLVKTIATEFHSPLASYQVQDINLKKYVVYKQDRRKNISKLPSIQPTFLQYKPLIEEQNRLTQLKKVYQHDQESQQLFGEYKISLNDFEMIKSLQEGSISQIIQVKHNQQIHIMKCISKLDHPWVNYFVSNLDQYKYHPFLIPLEYCFENHEKYFFIMQQAKCDLLKKLEELKKFDSKKIKFIASQLTQVLEHLQQKEIFHGDLTLENMLLDQQNNIALCDFGYLRRPKQNNLMFGIPEYVPPETIQHKKYDFCSDYWQLGIVLFEMAYGFPPFIDYELKNTFDYILNCQLEFPIDPEIDPLLKDLISKLLIKDPTQRLGYQYGISQIQEHPFFENVNWQMVYKKEVQPPDFEKKIKLL